MTSAPDEAAPAAAALPFGRLGRPHGVRGEVVLQPFNPGGARLSDLRLPVVVEVALPAGTRTLALVAARPFGEGEALLRLEGVTTREEAAALTHGELRIPRAALPAPGPGEVFVADLLGCAVFDLAGRPRGTVRGAFWNGSQDVLSIVADGGEELLIPAVPAFIQRVDLGARTMVIDDHE